MSSRDSAELPREHIFTLALFFRDQTRGNTELLCSSSHRLHQSIPETGFALLCFPAFCKGGGTATQRLEQTNGVLLSMCHLGFFLIIFCHRLFNCHSFLLFPLVFYFIFEIIYALPYLPNLAFPQCVFFILHFLRCFPMGGPTSYLTLLTGCIFPPLLDTREELLLPFFVPIKETSENEMLVVLL